MKTKNERTKTKGATAAPTPETKTTEPPADLPTKCPDCGGPVKPWITDTLRAVRCLSCPRFIVIENTAPVRRFNGLLDEETMRHQAARNAAALRDAWTAHASKLQSALNAGAADTMLDGAKIAIMSYPADLWRMGWATPECRDLAAVQSAKTTLDRLLDVAALVCRKIARAGEGDPAPFASGPATLRKVYEGGLLSAVHGDWPACMDPGEIERLPETTRGDLLALRDALARLNHASGGTAAAAQKQRDSDNLQTIAEATRAKTPPKRKPGPGRNRYYETVTIEKIENAILKSATLGQRGSIKSAAEILKMPYQNVKAIHEAHRKRQSRGPCQ